MKRIDFFVLFLIGFTKLLCAQQFIEINGKLKAIDDVEGVHVLNISAQQYTVSDAEGNFTLSVRLNDSLQVSSIKYYSKVVVVNQEILDSRYIEIELEELVNELDQVTVGKILTGDLFSDIKISDVKPQINFYDVGIPGNTNLPITQNERRLQEADHGKFFYYYGIGFAINVNKILNRVSGRTRKLKELVALDERDECMDKARQSFAAILFPDKTHNKAEIVAFFFFASEDERFKDICLLDNDMSMFNFLEEKHKVFLKNLADTADDN